MRRVNREGLFRQGVICIALQEFLASYAVKVDEDGARRLQRILDQNEASAKGLSAGIEAARRALAGLKAELSDTTGLKDVLGSLNAGLSGLSLPKVNGNEGISTDGGKTTVRVGADTSAAEEALDGYRSKAEGMRPKLNVNTSGITSAVSSAIAAVRSMMSSVSITIPVKAKASLDTSGLNTGTSGGSSGQPLVMGSVLSKFATGGRVTSPTLAMVGEVGEPEYIIPVKDDAKALPLIRDMMGELSASARAQLAEGSGGRTVVNHSVAAPVNISVNSTAAPAEAVGQFIYDTAQRSLLKTLEGVFA